MTMTTRNMPAVFRKNICDRGIVIGLVVLLCVGAIVWKGLEELRDSFKSGVGEGLTTVLGVTHNAIHEWIFHHFENTTRIAHDSDFIRLVETLQQSTLTGQDLLQQPALAEIRLMLRPVIQYHQDYDFFIITADGGVIGSLYDENIGDTRRFADHGAFLSAIFQGKTTLLLPMQSKIYGHETSGTSYSTGAAMFIGAPIITTTGSITSALIFQISPMEVSKIIEGAWTGKTGDSYAFDGSGRMISECRFTDTLSRTGLIGPGEKSSVTFRLGDPGDNIMQGFKHQLHQQFLPPLTAMAQQAISSKVKGYNVDGYRNYRGVTVVGAWLWDKQFDFGLAFEIEADEAFAPYRIISKIIGIIFLLIGILFIGHALLLMRYNKVLQETADKAMDANEKLFDENRERQKYQLALKKSEFQLRELFENMRKHVAICAAVDDGRDFIFKDLNRAALQSVELDKEKIIGRGLREVLPWVESMGILEVFQRVWQTGNPEYHPQSICKQNNIQLWLEIYVFKLSTGEIIVVFEDITERLEAERRLIRSKEEWERTFNSINDIITLQDKNMRIVKVNEAASRVLNADKKELIGRFCYELFSGKGEPCPGCPVLLSLQDMDNHCEIIKHEKLGRIFKVSTAPIFDKNNDMEYLIHVATDITEQKRLEEELLQSQKMEAIGTLAGGIAHDFNNILTPVIGFAEIARDAVLKGERPVDDLDQVLRAAYRARELVRQILAYSRKGNQKLLPVSPHFVIGESLKFIRSTLPTTIEIREKIDKECGTILADQTKIQQVVVNLCANAFHAMERTGGILTVTLLRKNLTAEEITEQHHVAVGSFVELMVSDTGQGMDKATMERIFEPYFTTKENGSGTGLGLAVVHGIVKSCGGIIMVASEINQGTTFRVYFPVTDAKQVEIKEEIEEILQRGSERILLVDDEAAIVTLQKSTLTALGYHVTATTDSRVALGYFRAAPDCYDLIITDQTMPALCGTDLASEILAVRPDLPIILCTGYSSTISEEKAMKAGVRKLVQKPFGGKQLARHVREALDES
ncbi:MAG: ATP-binding protein [Thermodesulfobacteriota bacterium]